MPMPHLAGCIDETLNERSECYEQSREKKYWMDGDADSYSQRNQQSRRRWFDSGH
jgi:hypothetical protein